MKKNQAPRKEHRSLKFDDFGIISHRTKCTYLFARFEDVTLEGVAASVASNIAKNFQIVAIMGDVEYPGTIKQRRKSTATNLGHV